MAEEPNEDLMGYDRLAQEALRGVVRAALRRAGDPEGLPGAHHLYISFKTHAAGVSAPPDLIERYPDEMTIVLQHQFWDLAPGETFFAITLRFGGQPKRLSVPYTAVTRFYDPSVQFLLQFEVETPASAEGEVVPIRAIRDPAPQEKIAASEATDPPSAPAEVADSSPRTDDDDGPKIVSLDRFRKK